MTIEELEAKIKKQEEALKVENAKVIEFRNNNIALTKAAEESKTKFDGVDVEKWAKFLEAEKLDAKTKLDGSSDLDKLNEKFDTYTADQDKKMKVLEAHNTLLKTQNETAVVDSALKDAAVKAGVSKTALADVVARGKAVWTAKDGEAVALDKDGTTILIKDTVDPLTMDKWVEGLNETAPHLFGTSIGTGAENPKFDVNIKTITRQTLDAMSQNDRASFFKNDGKVT
jgi:ribosomal protein L14